MLNLFTLLAKIHLNPMNWASIKSALAILGKGLLAIFAVIFVIIIVVKSTQYVITKAENYAKNKKDNEQNENEN